MERPPLTICSRTVLWNICSRMSATSSSSVVVSISATGSSSSWRPLELMLRKIFGNFVFSSRWNCCVWTFTTFWRIFYAARSNGKGRGTLPTTWIILLRDTFTPKNGIFFTKCARSGFSTLSPRGSKSHTVGCDFSSRHQFVSFFQQFFHPHKGNKTQIFPPAKSAAKSNCDVYNVGR